MANNPGHGHSDEAVHAVTWTEKNRLILSQFSDITFDMKDLVKMGIEKVDDWIVTNLANGFIFEIKPGKFKVKK